jgi:serine/threonine protein kinase
MFKDIEQIGGRYGKTFIVRDKIDNYQWVIKKFEFAPQDEAKLLKELQILKTIVRVFPPNTVSSFNLWLENNILSINGNKNGLILYIQMELCDTTLETVINETLNDSYIYENNTFTLLGFYITSYIFVEILKGINHLHKQKPQIFHCDLHSKNILIKVNYDHL